MSLRPATAVLAVVLLLHARASELPAIDTLLAGEFGFDKEQIDEVRRGRPVAVSLPGSIDREILVAGAIRIDAPVEKLLDRFRDIERFERGPGIPLIDEHRASTQQVALAFQRQVDDGIE